MGLCCSCALRGLCGFCTRVELGGLKACGVFASLFVLLPFFFCSCVCLLLCWLSFFALVVFLCPLALSLWLFGCVVVSFSLTDYTQKERAQFLASSLVLLWVVYKSLNITVISCGSSFQYLLPLQVIPATASGRFVGSFTVCRSLSIVEYLQ